MGSSDGGPVEFSRSTASSNWIYVALAAMGISGLVAVWLFNTELPPPPSDVAANPVLVRGRGLYLTNCANCHGPLGHGDGALSRSISGPPPRDFREEWKYGAEPDNSLHIVRDGAPNSSMPAWKSAMTESDMKSVTAYLYYLAEKPIPDTLR